jgi:hypothetical protein
MDDATINPVGAYDPVSRLPDGGGRGKQGPTGRKPSTRRPVPPASPAPAADPGPADPPDPDTPRGRRIDDRA